MRLIDLSRRRVLALGSLGMAVAALGPLAGCGGGGGGTAGGSPGGSGSGTFGGEGAQAAGTPGATVDATLRRATLDAVLAHLAARAGTGPSYDAEALASQLLLLPSLQRVGISSTGHNVWARFTDGQALVVTNSHQAGDPTAGGGPFTPLALRAQAMAAATAFESAQAAGDLDTPSLLTARQYRQLDMFAQVPLDGSVNAAHQCLDWVDQDTLPNLRRMAVGRGFTLPAVQTSDPPDVGFDNGLGGLASVSGDGVFFLTAAAAQVGEGDAALTVICTGTRASDENLARYAGDLSAGIVVHAVTMRGEGGSWVPYDCLAITPAFAQTRGWQFPTESLGILNLTGAPPIGDWFQVLDRAGLRHLMYWTRPVPWPRMLAFADDLIQFALATNNLEGTRIRQDPVPRLRAYGVGETLGHLRDRGLTGAQGEGHAAEYIQQTAPALFVNTLLPTIDYVLFRENRLEIEFVGQFGHRADASGTPARVVMAQRRGEPFADALLSRAADPLLPGIDTLRDPLWEGGLLQSVLDPGQLARGGYLQVVNGGRCSNVVPITHWEIPVQVVHTIDTLTVTLTVNVRLRADVHGWRLDPAGTRFGAFTSGVLTNSLDSNGTFAASGQLAQFEPTTRTRTTVTWRGGGSFGNAPGLFPITLSGTITWATRRMPVQVLAVGGAGLLHQEDRLVEEFDINGQLLRSSTSTADRPVSVAAVSGDPQAFQFQFDERWELAAGAFDMPPQPVELLGPRTMTTRLSWPGVVPDFPPVDDFGGT